MGRFHQKLGVHRLGRILMMEFGVTAPGSYSDKLSMQDQYETILRLVKQFLSGQSQGQGFYDSVVKLG